MLSRIADALFWIGRYVERADQTARILEENLQAIAEDPSSPVGPRCAQVHAIFGEVPEDLPHGEPTLQSVLDDLAMDRRSPSSVAGALLTARENARGAREVLPTEVWESLNTTTLGLAKAVRPARMHTFFQWSKDRCAVFNGLVDGSMPRDEAWLFLRLGQQLERVDMLARILQAHDVTDSSGRATVTLLRTCSAEEAYIRSFRGQVDAHDAIRFLLLDSLFPRSITHCLQQVEQSLDALSQHHGRSFDRFGTDDAARRIIGRVGASLRFRSLDDIVADFSDEMEQVQKAALAVSRVIGAEYFRPTL